MLVQRCVRLCVEVFEHTKTRMQRAPRMNPTNVAESAERLGNLSPAAQTFLLQLGLIVVALAALLVAMRALARRSR